MVPLAAGAVVLARFPFSGLSQTKLRPAIVLAHSGVDGWILCQVTRFARPGKLFTASASLIHSTLGSLKPTPFHQIVEALVAIVRPQQS